MKKVNALELRQSLSKIIALLQRNGEPILLEKGRRPAAVIISLDDYYTRFVEKQANQKRCQIRDEILAMARPAHTKISAEDLLRSIRDEHS